MRYNLIYFFKNSKLIFPYFCMELAASDRQGINVLIILFEYYGNYRFKNMSQINLLDHQTWQKYINIFISNKNVIILNVGTVAVVFLGNMVGAVCLH